MFFIHPMWYHESQRIGKQKCTPVGYALHVVAELIGFVGLLGLFATPVMLIWSWFAGTFRLSLFWLFALAFGLGIVSEVMFQFSWWLAFRKGFHYDDGIREASWLEGGIRRVYSYPPIINNSDE